MFLGWMMFSVLCVCIPRSGINGSYSNSMFNFWKGCRTLFYSGCTIFNPYRQCTNLPGHQCSNFSTILPTLVTVCPLITAIVVGVKCFDFFFKVMIIWGTVIPGHEMVEVPFLCKHRRERPSRGRCWTLGTAADWCESVISKTRPVGLPGSRADRPLLPRCLCCCSSATRTLEDGDRHQVSDICVHELALHLFNYMPGLNKY